MPVPGITPGNAVTGARALLNVGGQLIGYATDCTVGEDLAMTPIKVLGHLKTVEFVETSYDVTFTASRVRLFERALGSLGLFPNKGTSETAFLSSINEVFAGGDGISAVLQYRSPTTGGFINMVSLNGVKTSGKSLSLTQGGVGGEDITFVAIEAKDEHE